MIARSSFQMLLITIIASSSAFSQEVTEGTGLEVDDPSRLGVYLIVIPGQGLDEELVRMMVEREFAQAGVEMTDPSSPRENEVLHLTVGFTATVGEDPGQRSTEFTHTDHRADFWRPVHYRTADGIDHSVPAITWVLRGTSGGGHEVGLYTVTDHVCEVVRQTVRAFLIEFLKANGRSYAPTEGSSAGCGRTS